MPNPFSSYSCTGVGVKIAAGKAEGRNMKKLRDRNKKGDKEKVRDIKA